MGAISNPLKVREELTEKNIQNNLKNREECDLEDYAAVEANQKRSMK